MPSRKGNCKECGRNCWSVSGFCRDCSPIVHAKKTDEYKAAMRKSVMPFWESEESNFWRNKMSKERKAENNPNWKGDEIGYAGVHSWVKSKKPKPDRCEDCGIKNILLDLANISQKYLRDIEDWEYLCRRCHMTKDGRLIKLINYPKNKKPEKLSPIPNSDKSRSVPY